MSETCDVLVIGVGVFALLGVVVLKQELAVGVFDDGLGVGLDFVRHAEDFIDLGVKRLLRTEENVAVGMGSIVALFHKCSVVADLLIVTADKLKETHYVEI